jgi:hypothetical protein
VTLVRALCCCLYVATAAGPAVADGPRIAVVVSTPSRDELLARVRGQTSDLTADVVTVAGDADGARGDRLGALEALAAQHHARALLWVGFEPASDPSRTGRVLLSAEQPSLRRLLVRVIDCEASAAGLSSACMETVAVAVRSAVAALAEGAVLGFQPAPPAGPRWSVSAGWTAALDGQTAHGLHGGLLRLGLDSGHVEATLVAASTLPAAASDQLTTVEIARHTIAAGALYRRGGLGVGARAGLALFRRSTTLVRSPALVAAPARLTPSLIAGPELLFVHRPRAWRGVGASLGVGLDVVPGAPELVYDASPAPPGRRLWRAEPWAAIAVVVGGP